MRLVRYMVGVVGLLLALSACTSADPTTTTAATTAPPATTAAPTTTATPTTTTPPSTTTTTTSPPVEVDRIQVRTVDGVGEFYNVATGEKFIPRGTNYIDFRPVPSVGIADSVFAVGLYDSARVRDAFATLAGLGYNTVRIFYDICSDGPQCLVGSDGGWKPEFVDNIVDTMRIAAEEGIYIMFTGNSIPVTSRWQQTYDRIFGGEMNGLIQNLNGYWLHEAGIAARLEMFRDLLDALIARNAPLEAVLAWQIQNELWLDPTREPFNLSSGIVEAVAGSYDLADPTQRAAMVADAIVELVDRHRVLLDEYDPEGLLTVGFFAPIVATEWAYVDTASIIGAADVDFWDFHAYHDTFETLQEQAESFGMIGYDEKPIVLGETAGGKGIIPTALSNLNAALDWMAEACELGFDGWLNWGYYPWPDALGGKAWALLDGDGLLLEWAAPVNHPDMCEVPSDAPTDLARSATITASRSFPGDDPSNVVDGSNRPWNAGDFPPQWIEFTYDEPVEIARIGLTVEQWPPGQTRHEVIVTFSDGSEELVHEFDRYTEPETALFVEFATPLRNVTSVRIETIDGPAWVAWKEVSIVPADFAG